MLNIGAHIQNNILRVSTRYLRKSIFAQKLILALVTMIILVCLSTVTIADPVQPNHFPIGFWPTGMTDDSARSFGPDELDMWVEEAKFTLIYAYQWNNPDHMQPLLELAAEKDIQIIVCDNELYCWDTDNNSEKYTSPFEYQSAFEERVTYYREYPALFGYLVHDEPNASNYEYVYDCANLAQQSDPDHPVIVNQLPWFPKDYGGYYWFEDFGGYARTFLALYEQTSIAYLSASNYAAADPDYNGGGPKAGWNAFFESMYRYGQWCRENNRNFWQLLLATPHELPPENGGHKYEMNSEIAFRWQFNCSLAYGCNGIFYYTFYTSKDCIFEDGPINRDGNKTSIFYWMKNTHQRFWDTYGDLFLNLKLVYVVQVGEYYGLVPRFTGPDDVILSVSTPVNTFPCVPPVGNTDHPFIVSRFKDAIDRQYVLVVNNTTAQFGTVPCKVRFTDPRARIFVYTPNQGVIEEHNAVRYPGCQVTRDIQPGQEILYRIECRDPEELILYDDFSDPALSELRWTVEQNADSNSVIFDNGEVLLDMSIVRDRNWVTRSRIMARQLGVRFSNPSQTLRFTWDMQHVDPHNMGWITEAGDMDGIHIGLQDSLFLAGQGGSHSYGAPNAFIITAMPEDFIDRGHRKYHYDIQIIGTGLHPTDDHLITTHYYFKVYNHNSAYDNNPDGYGIETPVLSYDRHSTMPYDVSLDVIFFNYDPYRWSREGINKGAVVIDNVFATDGGFRECN